MKRKLERTWRKTRSVYDRSRYNTFVQFYNRKIDRTKNSYYTNLINGNSQNPCRLWSSINRVLHRKPKPSLPDNLPLESLPNKFSSFFIEKIDKISSVFPTNSLLLNENHNFPKDKQCLTFLDPATQEEIRKHIMNSSNAFCSLDPIPTILVKNCLDVLIKPISYIINKSLSLQFSHTSSRLLMSHPCSKNLLCQKMILKIIGLSHI